MNTIGISVISNRTHITLMAEDILYLSLSGRKTAIHITGDRIYETYTPIDELAKNLGSTFIRVDRCYLVSAKAIHDVTKTIDLINGESLDYARRRKREIVEQVRIERQKIGQTLERNDAPTSREAYHRHYASFDHVPFAFADIEMVFSGGLDLPLRQSGAGGAGKAAAGAAHRPLLRQHLSQHGRQMAAGL